MKPTYLCLLVANVLGCAASSPTPLTERESFVQPDGSLPSPVWIETRGAALETPDIRRIRIIHAGSSSPVSITLDNEYSPSIERLDPLAVSASIPVRASLGSITFSGVRLLGDASVPFNERMQPVATDNRSLTTIVYVQQPEFDAASPAFALPAIERDGGTVANVQALSLLATDEHPLELCASTPRVPERPWMNAVPHRREPLSLSQTETPVGSVRLHVRVAATRACSGAALGWLALNIEQPHEHLLLIAENASTHARWAVLCDVDQPRCASIAMTAR